MIDLVFKVLGTGLVLTLLLQIPLELRRLPFTMTRQEFAPSQDLVPTRQPQTVAAYLSEAEEEATGMREALDAA